MRNTLLAIKDEQQTDKIKEYFDEIDKAICIKLLREFQEIYNLGLPDDLNDYSTESLISLIDLICKDKDL